MPRSKRPAPKSAPRSVKRGSSRRKKVYTKRDVEVLVAMALAGAELARRKGWKPRSKRRAGPATPEST